MKKSRPITDALLKYKLSNFTLVILEYCSTDDLIIREQYYINLLTPEYNILKYAYSLFGYKHSEETLKKLKSKIISEEHKSLLSSIHKGKIISDETKNKLSVAMINYKKDNPLTPEALLNIKSKTTEREGVGVTVYNVETNEVTNFASQTEAGQFLGVSRQAIYNAIKRNSKVNGIFTVKKK